jgi:hypothetical protein
MVMGFLKNNPDFDELSKQIRHCEEQSDAAIQSCIDGLWIAALRSQ